MDVIVTVTFIVIVVGRIPIRNYEDVLGFFNFFLYYSAFFIYSFLQVNIQIFIYTFRTKIPSARSAIFIGSSFCF